MTAARYSLSENVASFDFFDWLVMVQALGATEIVFDTGKVKTTKWPEDVVRSRFESIILPGPALAGVPFRFGTDGDSIVSPNMREIVRWTREGGQFKRLRSVKPPRNDVQYTVTLRNDRRIPQRNSNAAAWRAFAAEIGAVVIEDYDDAPLHLHDRVTLYAGATMNFGIACGPVHLITLTDYPVMMFAPPAGEGGFVNAGIARGDNYPWALPGQRIVWASDDLPTLMSEFRKWEQRA